MSNEQKVSKTPKAPKVKFFDGVKAEFKKIIWPDKDLSLIHISEPTRRTPISYAVFCLKKKKKKTNIPSSA